MKPWLVVALVVAGCKPIPPCLETVAVMRTCNDPDVCVIYNPDGWCQMWIYGDIHPCRQIECVRRGWSDGGVK